ncbi:MAG TPA: restriction endonuclease subunit S [Longimicrobium sp.]|nr:restriction endonuclease subunit S [Longimicrobium sp.]
MYISTFSRCPPEWEIVPLPSAIDFREGPGILAKDFRDSGVPLLRLASIERPFADLTGCNYLDPDMVRQRWSHFVVEPGDLLVSTSGTLGRVSIATEAVRGGVPYTGIIRMRPAHAGVDRGFIRYFLSSPLFGEQAMASAAGSVLKHFGPSHLREMSFPLPPLAEQQAIAVVLGSLDDKIEHNRRMGRALEELARATFKAWFVDFEPVKAKAAGAAVFPGMPAEVFAALPDRLVESPIGPVPEGWEVTNIGTVAQRIAIGPFGSDIKTDNFVSDGVPVIRGGNLTNGFVDRDFVYLTEAKADQLSNANAFPGDIVITHRGTLGQIGLIPRNSRYKRYVVSQSQLLICPNAAMLPSHFLYLFLTSRAGQHELLANRSQTGVPAISRPTTSVKAISLVMPQRPVVEAFEGLTSTLFNARVAAQHESQKLAEIRDYLLPRLLSGRVRVRPSQAESKA